MPDSPPGPCTLSSVRGLDQKDVGERETVRDARDGCAAGGPGEC